MVFSLGALAAAVGGFLRWKRAKDEEDEEIMAQAKKIMIFSSLALAVFLIILGFIFFWKKSPPEVISLPPPPNMEKDIFPYEPIKKDQVTLPPPPSLQLGAGAIESHYPWRSQTNVPLNSALVIDFKLPMEVNDFMGTANLINTKNVRIKKANDPKAQELSKFTVAVSPDKTVFIFKPQVLWAKNTLYSVLLANEIKAASGAKVFGNDFYTWNFTTGSLEDKTSPRILQIQPEISKALPGNTMLEILFSEPVLVFPPAVIVKTEGRLASFRFLPAHDFRSLALTGKEGCGKNLCEEDVFCFAKEKVFQALLLAKEISDMALNTLDGNANGVAENSPKDDYRFSFSVGSEIKTGGPQIVKTVPLKGAGEVSLDSPLEIWFSSVIAKHTLNTKTITLNLRDVNWWLSAFDMPSGSAGNMATKVFIRHDPFQPFTTYYPQVAKGVKDLYQNCFSPPQGP